MQQRLLTDFFQMPREKHSLPSLSSKRSLTDSFGVISEAVKISPNVLRSRSKRRRIDRDDPRQMILDAGQNRIGVERCAEVG